MQMCFFFFCIFVHTYVIILHFTLLQEISTLDVHSVYKRHKKKWRCKDITLFPFVTLHIFQKATASIHFLTLTLSFVHATFASLENEDDGLEKEIIDSLKIYVLDLYQPK